MLALACHWGLERITILGNARMNRWKNRSSEDSRPRWTFLTNHAHVLTVLDSHPDMVLREVAQRVGITERAVQRIVMELEESGFLVRERVGRQNHYRVLRNKPLRHPIEAHRKIGDLLKLIKS